jgi:predicted transcriptional regulator YheO
MVRFKHVSEGELLMNYDLLEKSLYNLLGKGAEVILHDLKRELLVQAIMIDPNITISEIVNPRLVVGDILKRIHAVEAVEFVRKIFSYNHILSLHK